MAWIEIEQKFRLKHPEKIRALLRTLGARKTRGGTEHNEFYDVGGLLRRKRGILRLRRAGKKAMLTFKGPRIVGRHTRRVEAETPVDYESTRALLVFAGFRRKFGYAKRRDEFRLSGCLVSLDRLPRHGWFLEIEGRPRAIDRLARKFGLTNSDVEKRSYLELVFGKE